MGISALQDSMSSQADLVSTLMGGQMQQMDQSMKQAQVSMQMQVKMQGMSNAQDVVAQMTGVGGKLNIEV